MIKEEMKRKILFTPLFCAFMCTFAGARMNCSRCISRYAYDVNITLHLLLGKPSGAFIHHPVTSYRERWIERTDFVLHNRTESSLRWAGSISPCDLNAFTHLQCKNYTHTHAHIQVTRRRRDPEPGSLTWIHFVLVSCSFDWWL